MKSIFTRAGASTSLLLLGSAAAFVIATSSAPLQAQGAWKTLFDGKDFTGWVSPAGGGGGARGARAGGATAPGGQAPAAPKAPASTNPADRSWKVENGVISSVPTAISKQSAGGLNTVDSYKDFEFEFDYKLDEAPNVECTPKLGDAPGRNGQIQKESNLSKNPSCTFNSGISFRSGYQLNLGRREAGEYVGIVVHRQIPEAIRGNVDWLSTGDCGSKNHVYLQDCSTFPEIRKKGDWNHIRMVVKGTHIQTWMNDKLIVDVMDDATEAGWKDAGPIQIQFPPAAEGGEFGNTGTVKYRNLRIRTL
jgi:hypothetical protein